MAKKKVSAKTLVQQKRNRRKWVTFFRMVRYGVNNFSRNAWLTIAATAVMTITLFVIFISVVAQNVLTDTVKSIRDSVEMSIYLKTETTNDEAKKVVDETKKLSSVIEVRTITPEEGREAFIKDNKSDQATLDAAKEATNKIPWSVRIKVQDINDTSQLQSFVKDNTILKKYIDSNRPPSFAGDRKAAIESIARTANFARNIGIISSVIFVGIAMLIIFNTIRMAIFNRREEIQMMKLIGAERSFIRGPFIVEAVVYGFIAALIATGLGAVLLVLAAPTLTSYKVEVQPTLDLLTIYIGFAVLAMIIIGAIIGIISSLLATRRYLKF